jgi:signal transduction histidine kinase
VVNNIKGQVVNFIVIGILGTLLVSNLFAISLIRPIRKLKKFAEEVGKGNFKEKVELTTNDELEELAVSLNTMTKGLAELQRLKDEFVFIAAHELQAPVTTIRGYISLIHDGIAGEVSEQLKGSLKEIEGANNRLLQLIQDLLTIARSESGRVPVTLVSTLITTLVFEIGHQLEGAMKEKNLSFIYDPKTPVAVLADRDKLQAVLANLMTNAIKYNKEGGQISITHEVTGKKAITHVADTGIGISVENQKHLFEKFFRVKSRKTLDVSGTGLGLFIVQEALTRMNGRILVKSEEGKGSTFSFELQRA